MKLPPPPPPVGGLPKATHAMLFGYYLDGGVYGNFRNEVSNYTNVCNVWSYFHLDDLAGQRADFEDAMRCGRPIVWAPNQNPVDTTLTPAFLASLDVAASYWPRISYVFIDEPGQTQAQLSEYLARYRIVESARGLERKPIIVNFTNTQIISRDPVIWAAGIDIVGFEAYMDPSTQYNPNLAAMCRAQVCQFKEIVGARPTLVTIQGYDRNKQWLNLASLAIIQIVPYLALYDEPDIVGFMVFSLGRPGGSRELGPQITNEHRKIWEALR